MGRTKEHQGFLIKDERPVGYFIQKAGRGGTVPKALKGNFSSVNLAMDAIEMVVARKVNGNK